MQVQSHFHTTSIALGFLRTERERSTMRRREFIAGLGSAAAWPTFVRAQYSDRIRRIGVLMPLAESDPAAQAPLTVFRQGLAALGWVEARNLRIEYRWANGDTGRVRPDALELAGLGLDAILAYGAQPLAALKLATRTTPVVFVLVNDPVAQGFVTSISRPGENITGFSYVDYSVLGKAMEVLKKLAPGLARVAFMFNPDTNSYYETYLHSFMAVPNALSLDVVPARVRSDADITASITSLAGAAGDGLVFPPDPFAFTRRELIIRLATERRVPSATVNRRNTIDGALISYGPDNIDIVRRAADYIDRILKGEKPGDLPVQAPTKFEFVINLKAARALRLEVPPTLLAIADQVIE
jgi:putative tryptophan/tyrosine transport system substrate-binding protein